MTIRRPPRRDSTKKTGALGKGRTPPTKPSIRPIRTSGPQVEDDSAHTGQIQLRDHTESTTTKREEVDATSSLPMEDKTMLDHHELGLIAVGWELGDIHVATVHCSCGVDLERRSSGGGQSELLDGAHEPAVSSPGVEGTGDTDWLDLLLKDADQARELTQAEEDRRDMEEIRDQCERDERKWMWIRRNDPANRTTWEAWSSRQDG